MSIRTFDWRDLLDLHRYRHQSVFLYNSLLLTRGPLQIPGAFLSSFTPAMGLYTAVSVNSGATEERLIGQTVHPAGNMNAHLTFLTPASSLECGALPGLLEHLSAHAVERGAFRLLADVDESSPVFEALRSLGFAIYARQRIWQLSESSTIDRQTISWQAALSEDLIPVRSLYQNLTPGLVQQVEPFPAERLQGYVYHQGGEVPAFVELKYGHRGIWVQPFVHPDAETVAHKLLDLLHSLPNRHSRPVFICVRSYQSWLEPAIENLGAKASGRQALMVKHLAVPKKVLRTFGLPSLDGGQPEVTAPISRAHQPDPSEMGMVTVSTENN